MVILAAAVLSRSTLGGRLSHSERNNHVPPTTHHRPAVWKWAPPPASQIIPVSTSVLDRRRRDLRPRPRACKKQIGRRSESILVSPKIINLLGIEKRRAQAAKQRNSHVERSRSLSHPLPPPVHLYGRADSSLLRPRHTIMRSAVSERILI